MNGESIPSGMEPAVFRQLFETAPDAVVIVDADGRIILVNRQIERLFGFSREDLLGQDIEVLIPKRFRGQHVQRRMAFTHSPELRPMGSGLELRGRRQDGSEFPVEISLSPVSTERGFVSASIRDVTQQRDLELRTRRLQQYLLSAIDSIEGSFFIWDADDRLVLCNSAARAGWGAGIAGEFVGHAWGEVLQANLEADVFDLGDESAALFRQRLEEYHRAPSGAFSARTTSGRSLRIVERRTAEGGTVGLISDVTDDVAREADLREARAAAEAASSAKSEFLSSMSHELRTPLNAVLGFAQLLQRDKKAPLSARQQDHLGHVLRGGEHLLHLIDDVLDLARVETGRVTISVEPVAVGRVLDEVESTIQPMADAAEIQVEVVPVAGSLPDVRADRTRFKQILTNFASNAVKYGRRGGHVKLEASVRQGLVRVSVSDDGIGIATDKQSKVFEPFHRAGQETGAIEGTGIGLTISKQLAELMGGRVGFVSAAGEGSEFWVDLPSQELSVPGPRRHVVVPRGRLSGHRSRLIVYVEDNPSNVAFMKALLSDVEGVRLMVASSAEDGIELIRRERPALVIMDINLPGMSGIEALHRLGGWPESRDIPVVALSAAAMVGEAMRIEQAGFKRYLTKPVRVDQLLEVLEELLPEA